MARSRILVVEDDSIVLMELQDRLFSLGHDVAGVASYGEEAVEKAGEVRPDLVLMDIRLRGKMDGIKAAEEIRTRFDIPVVYLTAYADQSTLQRAKTTGPYGYVIKPFQEADLRTATEMALYKHKMEKRLKKSQQWLATILKSVGDAVIAADEMGLVTFLNPRAETLTGWRQHNAIGKCLADVFRFVGGEVDLLSGRSIEEMFGKGMSLSRVDDLTLLARDGKEVPIESSIAPIRDERGDITGVVLAFRDIGERQRAEEERGRLQSQLFQAQKMEAIGRLAAGVAHDFNNYLTVIMGNGQFLLSDLDVDDPRRIDAQEVLKAARSAASVTRQLLAFSRRQVLEPQVLDLNGLVANLKKMLGRLIGEDVKLITMLDPDLRRVKADPGQIEQVVMNLTVNARDAMPGGGVLKVKTENVTIAHIPEIWKATEVSPGARLGEYVCLSVGDTGMGMDEEILEHIFEPYFTTKGPGEGTGLGLSVVYGIVREHDGWVRVSSNPGQGSVFGVYLPVLPVDSDAEEENEVGEVVPLTEYRGHGKGVLLVEDDEEVRRYVAKLLDGRGYVVFRATDVSGALEVFEREGKSIHLVFSDVVLPDGTGLELVDQLLPRQEGLRVLLSSGYSDDRSRWSVARARGFPFVEKPYTPSRLLQTIENVMKD